MVSTSGIDGRASLTSVGPEQGITGPGMTIVGGDSHTTTHGALGSLAFGIGASQVMHVFATQTLWLQRPRTMLIALNGMPVPLVTSKDVVLRTLAEVGVRGAIGHAIEFSGSFVAGLPMDQRFTLCNLAVEAGARSGAISPDEITIDYASTRDWAPKGAVLERAIEYWRAIGSDADATFDRALDLDVGDLAPQITWGTSPDSAVAIDGEVPDPEAAPDPAARLAATVALEYMGLEPGRLLREIKVDRVFIGSCANGRLDDLRQAAEVARHGRAAVPTLVSPGSTRVKLLAEAEGLDQVFRDAGFTWAEAGCSLCVAINGDRVGPKERCVSTTNRNFPGRQGPRSRTHLASPATAAASALRGYIADPRNDV